MSRLRCLSTVIHVDEVSLFINDDSHVGREVARRIVARSTGFVRENPDDDASETDDVLSILLRRSCCVRFFAWLESTYVPSHLSLPFSSVWSSQLECQRTMKTMLEGSDLSAVCRDLFFMRQLVCEIFSIFFVPSRFGIVVERPYTLQPKTWCTCTSRKKTHSSKVTKSVYQERRATSTLPMHQPSQLKPANI